MRFSNDDEPTFPLKQTKPALNRRLLYQRNTPDPPEFDDGVDRLFFCSLCSVNERSKDYWHASIRPSCPGGLRVIDVTHCNRILKNLCVGGACSIASDGPTTAGRRKSSTSLGIPGHQVKRPSDQSSRLFSCKVHAQMMACLMALMAV